MKGSLPSWIVCVTWALGACVQAAEFAADSGSPYEPDASSTEPARAPEVAGAAAPAPLPQPDPQPEPEDADAGLPDPMPAAFVWRLPPGFPQPLVPTDNPMSDAKVELGRHLFYDTRLSDNQTQACSTCHVQALAFTDGRARAIGSTGESHPRGSMSLANVAYATSLTWANPLFAMGVLAEPLERQSLLPLYSDAPVELGLRSQAQLEARLRAVPDYRRWFANAFPDQAEPITAQNVGRALAAFERTLISGRSAFDRYLYDHDDSALSPEAKRGYALFASERLACSRCHSGYLLSDQTHAQSDAGYALAFHNTALYDTDGHGAYPEPNTGVYNVTQAAKDMGAFRAPTLRNIAVTPPYMHDGSIDTLSQVLDHYAAGGRAPGNPLKDPLLHGFELTPAERADLLVFLDSLTDTAFLSDPAFADPW